MGFGDELMGSGMARGARQRGERIAFGDGAKIIWSHNAPTIYAGNENVARPGEEHLPNLKWIEYYPGKRQYATVNPQKSRWIWNYDFKAKPGEVFFSPGEQSWAEQTFSRDYILIEPNVPIWKKWSVNKVWKGYQEVASALLNLGYNVVQFEYPGMYYRLSGVKMLSAPTMRSGLLCMSRARLFIGPEGGMHHAAAALDVPAVVLFGGYVPPSVTGYDTHANLTGGAEDACGLLSRCLHCEQAMKKITPEEVVHHTQRLLR